MLLNCDSITSLQNQMIIYSTKCKYMRVFYCSLPPIASKCRHCVNDATFTCKNYESLVIFRYMIVQLHVLVASAFGQLSTFAHAFWIFFLSLLYFLAAASAISLFNMPGWGFDGLNPVWDCRTPADSFAAPLAWIGTASAMIANVTKLVSGIW